MGCWTRDEMCGLAEQERLPGLGGTQTRTPLCGFRYRLCAAIGVDHGQSRERTMSALKIIRKRAKKAINLEAARNLMARRQLAGA